MAGVEIPHWFNIDRYELGNSGEKGRREAMLAVLDRVMFYRIAIDPSIDPTSVGAEARRAAQQALQHWSEHPYYHYKAGEGARAALVEALPAAPEDTIRAFEKLGEDAGADERSASQRELRQLVDSVGHLPPDSQWQAVEEEARRRRQSQAKIGEGADLLKPTDLHMVEKLLRYRAAAYIDLTIWGTLLSNTPSSKDLGQAHRNLWPDGPDWRSIARLLEQLKDRDLGFYTRLDKRDIFRGGLRNARRRNGRT